MEKLTNKILIELDGYLDELLKPLEEDYQDYSAVDAIYDIRAKLYDIDRKEMRLF